MTTPEYNLINDLKEKLNFDENEYADTPHSDRVDKAYLRGRLIILRYVIRKLEEQEKT